MVALSLATPVRTDAVTKSLPSMNRGKYVIRLARNRQEIEAAMKLRFAVFNVELGEGFASSFATGRDQDSFDDLCDHLILIDRIRDQIIGTCRLRTYEFAKSPAGFYSSTRFNLHTLPGDFLKSAVEFGRVCITRPHRNRDTFKLMAHFLAAYAERNQKRYLFGCCSFKSQDPMAGGQLFEWLNQTGHTHAELKVAPQPGFKCIFYKTATVEYRILPSTIHTYLKMGAKICGMPAIDREFRTIEFLTILDLNEVAIRRATRLARAS